MERILIIDDEPDIQELLRNYLEEEGIRESTGWRDSTGIFADPEWEK